MDQVSQAVWTDINWTRREIRVRGTKTAGPADVIPLAAIKRALSIPCILSG